MTSKYRAVKGFFIYAVVSSFAILVLFSLNHLWKAKVGEPVDQFCRNLKVGLDYKKTVEAAWDSGHLVYGLGFYPSEIEVKRKYSHIFVSRSFLFFPRICSINFEDNVLKSKEIGFRRD